MSFAAIYFVVVVDDDVEQIENRFCTVTNLRTKQENQEVEKKSIIVHLK